MRSSWYDCYALGEMDEDIPVDCESGEALEESDGYCYGIDCLEFEHRVQDKMDELGLEYERARERVREELFE